MEWDNLLSGLIGAGLGVLGAVFIQWRETRRSQAAAARAIFMEAAANNSALAEMMRSGLYATITSAAWAREQGRLAHALSPGDFAVVATYYMRIDLINGSDIPATGVGTRRARSAATGAFARGELAASILEKRGWLPWERKALHRRLAELHSEQDNAGA